MAMDLEQRIQAVELRLIDREEGIRRQLGAGWRSLRRQFSPRRLRSPALMAGGAALLLGLWRLQRGRRHPVRGVPRGLAPRASGGSGAWAAGTAAAAGAAPLGAGGGAGWIRLLGLAWPLLPAHLRARVSPAMASAAVSLGLPLAEWLVRRPPSPLLTVDAVDARRFSGRWHVVASLAPRLSRRAPITGPMDWVPQPDGSIEIRLRSSTDAGGSAAASESHTARTVPGTAGTQLEWSDWPALLQALPAAWEAQAVVHVDPHYQEALVGNPARSRLWLMSRDPEPPLDRLMALVQLAHDRGYAADRLVFDPSLGERLRGDALRP